MRGVRGTITVARATLLMFAAAILITALRTPKVLGGRFWAEEGPFFYVDLQHATLLQATGYLYRGSLQLLTNWAMWAATRAPMEWAPLVSTWFGMAVLLVLGWTFAVFAASHRVSMGGAIAGFIAAIMLPGATEVIANATNLQWVCSMIVALVAFTDDQLLYERRWPLAVIVLLAGLTGVPSCMLAPVFLYRGWIGGARGARFLSLVLLATTAVQVLVLFASVRQPRPFVLDPPLQLLSIGLNIAVVPLVGAAQSMLLTMRLFSEWASTTSHLAALAVVAVASIGVVAITSWIARRAGASWQLIAIVWLTAIAVCLLNQFGGLGRPMHYMDPRNGQRYFVVGQLCLIVLLVLGTAAADRRASGAAMLMLGAIMLAGSGWIGGALLSTMSDAKEPAWAPQVARCRSAGAEACRLYMWPHVGTGTAWTGVWHPRLNTLATPYVFGPNYPTPTWAFGAPATD